MIARELQRVGARCASTLKLQLFNSSDQVAVWARVKFGKIKTPSVKFKFLWIILTTWLGSYLR